MLCNYGLLRIVLTSVPVNAAKNEKNSDILEASFVFKVKGKGSGTMGRTFMRTDQEIIALYEKYVDMVYRICFSYLKNTFDTEDAVQDTFIKLIRHSKSFASPNHEKAWLIVTTVNTCKDALRRSKNQDVPLDEYEDCLATFDTDPASRDILDAVCALPPKYKSTVYLYYYEGYSSEEIASFLHKPASTIRNYLHEARALLKKQLGGDWNER